MGNGKGNPVYVAEIPEMDGVNERSRASVCTGRRQIPIATVFVPDGRGLIKTGEGR
jgi:hypothetical protein